MTAMRPRRRVLVTGARGYLGGRICCGLAAHPEIAVLGASRTTDRPERWPGADFIRIDPNSGILPTPEMLSGVEAVIHLAGPDQARSAADPLGALAAVTGATIRLLEAAIEAKVRRFVYVSTAHVYGMPLVGRIDEQSLPRPVHPYAITRRAAEDFVLAAYRSRRIEAVVVRLSNGIGAPAWREMDQWHTVGNDLCRQAVVTGGLKLSSSGEQWRDFLAMTDVVSAMLHLLDLPAALMGDGLFNLGRGISLRIVDFAELVAERAELLFGRRPSISRLAGVPVPMLDYRIDKIRATGFEPTGDIGEEIEATLRLCAEFFTRSPMAPRQ